MKVRRLPDAGPTHHRQYINSRGSYVKDGRTSLPSRTDSRHPMIVSSWATLHRETNRKSFHLGRSKYRKAQNEQK